MEKQNKTHCLPGLFRKPLLACVMLLFCTSLFARKVEKDTVLNRTVIVENEYNPEIMDASKINILPPAEEPVATKKDIEYSVREIPASSFGTYQTMPSLTEKPLQENVKRGYARLGYGNYGNVDGRLSYLFDLSKKDRLALSAGLDGMNGSLKLNPPYGVDIEPVDWKSRYYSTRFGIDYTHLFNKISLNLTGKLGSDNFNYHQVPVLSQEGTWKYMQDFQDKQHQMKGQFRVSLASSDETLPLQFTAEAGYLYFSKKYNFGVEASDKEQIMLLKANVWGRITDEQKVGIKLDMDNLFYTSPGLDNYTSLQLNPYYALENDSWRLKLGVHADLAFGKGKIIEVAPDVNIQYIFADSYVLYLNASGGRILNDYRRLEAGSPYWAIMSANRWKNTYVPLDMSLGLKASPFEGFRFDLSGGYQIRNNDLCLTGDLLDHSQYAYSNFMSANTKALYAGLQLTYHYKDKINLSGKGTYYHWDAKESQVLLMKPELEINLQATIKAMTDLYVNLGYEYTARSEVLSNRINNLPAGFNDMLPYRYKMNAINNLSLGVTYNVWKDLSVYAKLNNILNREYQYYYSYPVERINFLAGFSFKF